MKTKLLFFILTFPLFLNAQEYLSAVGLRGGLSSGVTCRFFSNDENAIEALLSFRDCGIQLTAMEEKFMPVFLNYSEHIFLYYGYGGHLGYSKWPDEDYYNSHRYYINALPLVGIDGIAGLEYRFYKFPVTTGIDFKPFSELGGRRFFRLNLCDFGITLKYTFKK